MSHTPVLTKPGQRVFRFPNGYGASVVNHEFSYGQELAVIRFASEDADDFALVYDTPITDDVLGWLSDDDVTDALDRIAALPNPAAR